MWAVVYSAENQVQAEMIKNLLIAEGVLANIRSTGIAFLGDGVYEVLVLADAVDKALDILVEYQVKE